MASVSTFLEVRHWQLFRSIQIAPLEQARNRVSDEIRPGWEIAPVNRIARGVWNEDEVVMSIDSSAGLLNVQRTEQSSRWDAQVTVGYN